MNGLTINELVDILAQQIAAGRGDDNILVSLYGDDIDGRMQGILDRHNWTVTEAYEAGDHRTHWIHLDVRPEQ